MTPAEINAMEAHTYSLIQFLPNLGSREAVNIGAVVAKYDSEEWSHRYVKDFSRVRALVGNDSTDKDYEGFCRITTDIFQQCAVRVERGVEDTWMHKIWEFQCRSVVQLTEPIPMLANDPESALDTIFENQVVDPTEKKQECLQSQK